MYILYWIVFIPPFSHGYSYWEEMVCRDAMFANYSAKIRPVINQSDILHVNFTFELLNIEDLNIKTQVLTATAWTIVRWKDELLTWDEAKYGGVSKFFVYGGDAAADRNVWKPMLSLENAISEFTHFDNGYYPVIVDSDGTITMESGFVLTTHCEMDVTYYPFDQQECDVIVASMIFNVFEVHVKLEEIKMDNYRINFEWDLIDVLGSEGNETLDKLPQSVIDIKIRLLRRRPFYILQLVFPLFALSILNVVVFLLPAESGEKMSLAITTLLSYAVFLSFIGNLLPSTSHTTPALAIYVLIAFIISVMAVCLSVLVLIFHHHEMDHVPRYLKIFTCGFLGKLMYMRRKSCPVCNKDIGKCDTLKSDIDPLTPTDSRDQSSGGRRWNEGNSNKSGNRIVRVVPAGSTVTPEAEIPADASLEHDIDWKGVASVMSRFVFWLTLLLTVALTCGVLMTLTSQ